MTIINLQNQDEYMRLAAADVESTKKDMRDAQNKFMKAVLKFTQLRFKTVKYFRRQSFNPTTEKMAYSMFIKVRASDEQNIAIDFVSITEYGKNAGQDLIDAEDRQVGEWQGITEAEYLQARATVLADLKLEEEKSIITL